MKPPTDVSLGEKVIPFRIRAHDPREFPEFKQNWIDGGYTYKVEEMEADTFHHRLGKHPTIDMILQSLPIVSEDKIPTTGKYVRSGTCEARYNMPNYKEVCAEETEAIIIDNRNHQKLIHALKAFVYESSNIGFTFVPVDYDGWNSEGKEVREMDPNHGLRGDIVATWDEINRSGVSIVSLV